METIELEKYTIAHSSKERWRLNNSLKINIIKGFKNLDRPARKALLIDRRSPGPFNVHTREEYGR